METRIIQSEIETIRLQLKAMSEKFDKAIENDVELKEARKFIHEIKILRERLEQLNRDYGNNSN